MREGFPALEGKKILGLDILPWSGTNRVSLALISLSIFSLVYSRFSNSEQSASYPNPFLLLPESSKMTVARTHSISPRPSQSDLLSYSLLQACSESCIISLARFTLIYSSTRLVGPKRSIMELWGE